MKSKLAQKPPIFCMFGVINTKAAIYTHLRHKTKDSKSSRGQVKNRVSVHDRPAAVDQKKRIGDWEIDLMINKDHSGSMVTIVERVSNFTVAARIDDKPTATVTAVAIALL